MNFIKWTNAFQGAMLDHQLPQQPWGYHLYFLLDVFELDCSPLLKANARKTLFNHSATS